MARLRAFAISFRAQHLQSSALHQGKYATETVGMLRTTDSAWGWQRCAAGVQQDGTCPPKQMPRESTSEGSTIWCMTTRVAAIDTVSSLCAWSSRYRLPRSSPLYTMPRKLREERCKTCKAVRAPGTENGLSCGVYAVPVTQKISRPSLLHQEAEAAVQLPA